MMNSADLDRIWTGLRTVFVVTVATTAALTLALGALVGMVAAWLGGGA